MFNQLTSKKNHLYWILRFNSILEVKKTKSTIGIVYMQRKKQIISALFFNIETSD